MKKICFIVGNLNNSGGTERVCSIVANELSSIGYDISILSMVEGTKPFFSLNEGIDVESLFPISGRTLYRTPAIIYKLRNYLKKESIDTLIVVESMSVLFTLPAIQGLSIKHICWEHFNFKNDLGKSGRRLARQLAARYCDAVVTLTERDKLYWLEGANCKAQMTSIPNPSPFVPQEYIKKDDSKTVLAVGRLTPIKGFDLLIQSWIKVSNTHSDWKLTIVGEGEDREKLQALINTENLSNSIKLVGNSNNIEYFYKNSDIFCLSSRFEGFPMVLLEALAFGLPIVSFDCDTGPAEILKNTGSILVPPNCTELLADALINLIESKNLREEIKLASIKKAQTYQPEYIMRQWDQLLCSLG